MTIEKQAARRITLVDVARHAGVSVATASKAVRNAYGISDTMQARVLASVEALGYRPDRLARGMRGSTFTVGLVVPSIENSFNNLIVKGMTPGLEKAGYDLFIAAGDRMASKQDSVVDALIDHQMDGLVLVAPRQDPRRLDQIGRSIPTVVVGRHGPGASYDTIASDDHLGSRLIVEHLLSLGHERITFIAESPNVDFETLPEHVRLEGYRQAMEAQGLASAIDIVHSSWTFDGGQQVAATLLDRGVLPTAVHAGADVAAFGLMSGLWDAGVDVPEQVSVAGYDNAPTGALKRIGLTSVEQGGIEMGESAAHLLLSRIHGRTEPVDELKAPRLIVRGTTAAPFAD